MDLRMFAFMTLGYVLGVIMERYVVGPKYPREPKN